MRGQLLLCLRLLAKVELMPASVRLAFAQTVLPWAFEVASGPACSAMIKEVQLRRTFQQSCSTFAAACCSNRFFQ